MRDGGGLLATITGQATGSSHCKNTNETGTLGLSKNVRAIRLHTTRIIIRAGVPDGSGIPARVPPYRVSPSIALEPTLILSLAEPDLLAIEFYCQLRLFTHCPRNKHSEKRYEQLSDHNFGRYTEANIDRKAILWQPEG
jgi:hypothetical protein